MSCQHPLQCIQCLRIVGPQKREFIVTAAGSKIIIFDALTGSRTSAWPAAKEPVAGATEEPIEPPGKRRKLTPPSADEKTEQPSDVTEAARKESESKRNQEQQQQPNVVLIATSSQGGHVVAATGEDKCIRVFEVDSTGLIIQLSERCMPKRPSAIKLCNDDSIILVADKFGDVFSLPLHYDKDKDVILPETTPQPSVPTSRHPAATNSTVHTKGNLRALEQQREQAAKEQIKERKTYTFPHTLLLGHVSMVTDIEYITLHEDSKKRPYLLSADRDEHIRISRGIPQTHIIEGYCFGHESFVNKLSVPSWDRNSLISGGGDNYLLLWDWLENRIRQRVELELDALHEDGQPVPGPVTGIWAISFAGHPIPLLREVAMGAIIVALERCPRLCVYLFGHERNLIPQPPISLSGNILDLTVLNDAGVVMVSVDDTADSRTADSQQNLVQMLTPSFKAGSLEWTILESPVANSINSQGTFDILQSEDAKERQKQRHALDSLLYSASTLKKGVGAANSME